MSFIVAIDGPAGTGKGTIAKLISKEMGLINVDTGITYRCVALYTLQNGINIDETEKIISILPNINIEIENETQRVLLNGNDVTQDIRIPEVSKIVAIVASIAEVRYAMVEVQRNLAKGKDVIVEGRDITTYVFPNAQVKIYMDAAEEVRAKRRHEEMKSKGIEISYEEVLNNIQMRDNNDKNKKVGALKIADDAIYVDTTNLTIEEVKEKIKKIICEKRGK